MRRLLSFMLLFCFCVGSLSGCQGKQFFSSVPVSCKVQEPGGGEAEITDAALLTQLTDLVFSCDILKGAIPSGQKGYLFSFRLEDGTEETALFQIVGSAEANPMEGRISDESPVGKALVGHRCGDKVNVETAYGVTVYEILAVDMTGD